MEIRFRKLAMEDLPLRMKWLNDPEVNKHLGHRVRNGMSEESHCQWFAKYFADDANELSIIEVDGKPVGQVGLNHIDHLDKHACLYLTIGEKDYWGKGVGSAAMAHILDYGFNTLGLHKIYLEVHARNKVAITLYEKFGFVKEGLFKENVLYDDGFDDEIRMAKIQKIEP